MALTVTEAVALIIQLARSPQTGRPIRARLDASHVWLHDDGTVTLSPGLLPPLSEVAALLDTLLGRVETASGMPLGLVSLVEQVARHKAGFHGRWRVVLAPAVQPPDPAALCVRWSQGWTTSTSWWPKGCRRRPGPAPPRSRPLPNPVPDRCGTSAGTVPDPCRRCGRRTVEPSRGGPA
jgi:hypothetical protein